MKTCKAKSLVSALAVAGIVGGFAGVASAAAVNPDGLGEALIYPYITSQNSNATLISVVNTSNAGKVVKVRFREAKNSNDVLDFNLYLSAYDVWTGAVLAATGKDGVTPTGGSRLVTEDTSCTGPHKAFWPISAANGYPLAAGQYGVDFSSGDYDTEDGTTGAKTQGLARTTQGYLEIIEQATVPTTTTLYKYIDHRVFGQNGVPACNALHRLLGGDGGSAPVSTPPISTPAPTIPDGSLNSSSYTWTSQQLTDPSGGLFGSAAWINVGNGMSTAQLATALNGFDRSNKSTVQAPASQFPNFADHVSFKSAVITASQAVVVDFAAVAGLASYRAALATSAPLMASNVYGEYYYSPATASGGLSGSSDWVVTFPTKRFFVSAYEGAVATVPAAPFPAKWDTTKLTAPVGIAAAHTDREEKRGTPVAGCVFSPCNQDGPSSDSLNYEVNVLAFGPAGYDTTKASGSLNANGAKWLLGLNTTSQGGWLDLSFTNAVPISGAFVTGLDLTSGNSIVGATVTFAGLPVVGFASTGAMSTSTTGLRDSYRHSSALAFRKGVTIR